MAGINNLDPDDVSDADDVPDATAVSGGGCYAMVLSSQLAKGIIKVNRLEQDRQALATLDHKRELLNGKVEALANDPDVLGFQELFEQLVVEPDLYVSHLQVKDDVAVCRYGYPGRVYYTDSTTKKALHDKGIEAEPIPPQNQATALPSWESSVELLTNFL